MMKKTFFERRGRENFAEDAEEENQKIPKVESHFLSSGFRAGSAGFLFSLLLNFFSASSAKFSRPLRSKMHFSPMHTNHP
jgi:hypothetical protein